MTQPKAQRADAAAPSEDRARRRVLVVGAGPAGLMAAEAACDAGAEVIVHEQMPSPARKFLIAGKGGLNLTHSESKSAFVARYGAAAPVIGAWLGAFDADGMRAWARGLGYDTVVGSSGRVFPADFKAGPLLRAWLRRLRGKGIVLHCSSRWLGWGDSGHAHFAGAEGESEQPADALILALGGASWSKLGADGRWAAVLESQGIRVNPFAPSNCGFDCNWSEHFRSRHAGSPVKSVGLQLTEAAGRAHNLMGEFLITDSGVEGSAIYALSAALREHIAATGSATVFIDLMPQRSQADIETALAQDRGSRSRSEHWRRRLGLAGVRASLLRELAAPTALDNPTVLAATIKRLPLRLLRPRPLDEAISSAGGVPFAELTRELMLRRRPGVYCVGEMLDWEAPTGGYLLTACFASGYLAGRAAARIPPRRPGQRRPGQRRPGH